MRTAPTLGIIGAGAFSEFCLTSYSRHLPRLKFGGVYDTEVSLAKKLAQKFSIPRVYSDHQELLTDPLIQFLLILTPPNTHYDLTLAGLKAGKHILVEKPIAFTPTQARQLIGEAQKRNLQLGANLVLRFHPFHRQLRKLAASKKVGSLRQIATTALLAEYPQDHWYWQPAISGGFFLNTYCHFLDLYDFVVGAPAKRLYSAGSEDYGRTIIANFPKASATLTVNLHTSNAGESVRTIYAFEKATVTTEG